MRRAAILWVVLFGIYSATIGLHALGRSDYAGDEPHYLLTAKSLVDDGDVDVLNQYRTRRTGRSTPTRSTRTERSPTAISTSRTASASPR